MKTKLSFRSRSIAVFLTTALLLVALPVMSVFALTSSEFIPTANGTYTSWSGIYSDVDEGTGSASCSGTNEYLSSSTANARESVSIPLTSVPDGATITSVNVLVRDRRDSADGGTYATFVRFNGTDSANSSTHTVSGSGTSCTGSVNDSFDVPDAVKNGSTTLEVGVVKLNNTAIRIGVLSATITYSIESSGATNAGAGADNAGVGTITWTNPGNVVANDDANATVTSVPAGGITHYLQATNFGFNIPSGSTIFGIQATIGKSNSGGTGNDIRDNIVSLIKGGAITGNNKAATGVDWPTSETPTTYGSSSDTWGTTWTPDEINASDFGLALSVTNAHPSTAKNAAVDYMQITVFYELPTTTTSINCVQSTITFGETSVCSVTVTRGAGTNTPAGSVSLASDAGGSFTTCILSNNGGGSASCSSTYTPSAVGDGSHLITSTYAGNSNFRGSNASQTITINKIATSLSISNPSVTYNSLAQAAVVTGSVPGVISDIKYFNGVTTFTTARTEAGTYAVTADFVPTDPNYASLSDASAGNFVIDKANANCSSITGYNLVYDGAAHSALGSCVGVGSDGVLAGLYLGDTTHTNVGVYNGNPWGFFDITGNYNDTSGTVNSTITKANPNCSISGYNVIYDSASHTAGGSCQGVGGEGPLAGLSLTATTHTNAGTYNNAPWFFNDVSGNYLDDGGTINSLISPANPVCTINPYNVTYNGLSHISTGSCQGVGSDGILTGLFLGDTAETNAGNYNSPWAFFDVTGNYNDANGTVNNVIAKADAIINVTPYNVTYDGNSHTSTGTATGIGSEDLSGLLNLSGTTHTNAGAYSSDPWTFAGSTNYNSTSGTTSNNIAKANAIINVTPYDVTYDGNSHTSTGTATGINSEDLSTGLDFSATAHVNAGDYTGDTWTFSDVAGNYNDSNGTVDNSIAKANATINVTPYDVTYDSDSHTATGTATGINSEDLSSLLNLSGTTHTNANVYSNDPWSFAGNTNYNSTNGTLDNNIAKTDADCSSIAGYAVTYDTNVHTASGSCQGVGSDGTLSGLDLSATAHTNAGNYNGDAWIFTNSNYNNQNGIVNSSIAKANANCSSIAGYTITYDTNTHTASGSCQGVGSDGTLSGLDLSATTHTNAGDYNNDPWAFTNTNYASQNGTVNSSITKANPNCSITGYSVTYDANAHTASGSCQGVGSDGTLSGLDLSATTHTNASVYNGDIWTFNSSNANYNNTNGIVNNSIAKTNANCTITPYNITYDASPHTASGSCQGVGSDGTLSGLDLSATIHTSVGNYNGDNWAFADITGNYNNTNGTVDNNIAKANPSCNIAGYTVYHDGQPHTASGSCQGVGTDGTLATLDLSQTTHTDVGTYNNDPWTFTDVTGNYNNANGTVNSLISDSQLIPTLTASGGPFTYDGSSHTASVNADAAGTVSDVKYNGSSNVPVNAGTYSVTADFTPTDTVTYAALNDAAAGSITINKADANCSSITGYTVSYNGLPHSASGSCQGVGSDGTLAGLNLSATTHTNVGTYNGDIWAFIDSSGNYNNTNGTVNNLINKVTLTVTASNKTIISGNPDPAFTFSYSGFVNSETSSVIDTQPTCTVSGAHSAPGSYPIVCSGGADNNYAFTYVNGTLTVNAANNPPTNISLSNNSINENQAIGTLVGTLSTSDPDVGDSFTYSFCGGTDDASFTISGSNLQSAASFDFEVKNSYSICIRTTDSGALSTTKTFTISVINIPDTQTFQDVPMNYWAWSFIERLYTAGITGGCSTNPLNYCPTAPVTRAQMAVFLLKGIHGSAYTPPAVAGNTGFTDVATDYWAAAWIKQLAAEGITGGCGVGLYCPENTVTRDQMAIFLLRSTHGSAYTPPAATGVFTDVPTDYWAAAWIEQLAAEGITSGCAAGTYCPTNPVTRGQMAVFLVKAFALP